MFPAYSVEAQAPGAQGKCRHTRAKYFSTSKTSTKKTTAVRYGSGAVISHTPSVMMTVLKCVRTKVGKDRSGLM